ncbi:GH25 family lysozyme [Corynebacterium sp. 335C]
MSGGWAPRGGVDFGVDVSEWQDGLPLAAAADAGMRFAVVRACDGTYADRCCASHIADARDNGLEVSSYWYVRHTSEGTTFAEQAGVVMRQLRGAGAEDAPVWLDCETPARLTADDVHAAADALRAAGGRVAGMYTMRSYWRWRPAPDLGGLWLAQWPGGAGYPGDGHRAWRPFRGTSPGMWQFTDSAQLAGFAVDVSARRGA